MIRETYVSDILNVCSTNSSVSVPFWGLKLVCRRARGPALLQHQEPIVPSGFRPAPPWCHGHEAARWWAESDGYLYRNISFPRQPPFTLKASHVVHQYRAPGRSPGHGRPTCGGMFSLHTKRLTANQIQRDRSGSFWTPPGQSPAHEAKGLGGIFAKGKLIWGESAVQRCL